MSNDSEVSTRLSLLNYFGKLSSSGDAPIEFLDKIMSRFGHTVLDSLFQMLLFEKKTEATAMQFLRDNFGNLLRGGRHTQRIIFETLKYYMLKKPDRFCLFVQTFAEHIHSDQNLINKDEVTNTFVQHIFLLLKVASEVNHKVITKELLQATLCFKQNKSVLFFLEKLHKDEQLRPNFKDYVKIAMRLVREEKVKNSIISQLKPSRRGRRPAFAKAEENGTIGQIGQLSKVKVLKAS